MLVLVPVIPFRGRLNRKGVQVITIYREGLDEAGIRVFERYLGKSEAMRMKLGVP